MDTGQGEKGGPGEGLPLGRVASLAACECVQSLVPGRLDE